MIPAAPPARGVVIVVIIVIVIVGISGEEEAIVPMSEIVGEADVVSVEMRSRAEASAGEVRSAHCVAVEAPEATMEASESAAVEAATAAHMDRHEGGVISA